MYPKISKFDLAKLRKVEFLQMMKNIRTHVECFGTNVLGISLFSTSSQPCWIRRLPPLEMERSNTYSQAIDEGDQLRDSACRVSYYFVKAFIFSSHPQ